MGIYVDNFNSNLNVHHNVVWNCNYYGMNYSRPAVNILWANNTVFAAKAVAYSYIYSGAPDTSRGNRLWNNLMTTSYATDTTFSALDQSRNIVLGTLPLKDPANLDFRPVAGSAAIDSGAVIPGITDGYLGRAPDVGAYKYGGIWWKAGAWSVDDSSSTGIRSTASTRQVPWQVEGSRIVALSGCELGIYGLDGRRILSFRLPAGGSKDLAGAFHGTALVSGSGRARLVLQP
jgi:hypothetical protein